MKIFHKLGAISAIFATRDPLPPEAEQQLRQRAAAMAGRWSRARRMDPELMGDLIRLGGLLVAEPFEAGQVADLNRDRILYEKGRRDMALQICALMGVTETELSIMMETNNVDQIPR